MKTRISRKQLVEAFKRGYRAARKRLNEGMSIAQTKEISRVVRNFLDENLPEYNDDIEDFIIDGAFGINLKNHQCDGQEEFDQAIAELDDFGKEYVISQAVTGLTAKWERDNPESRNEPMIRALSDKITRELLKYAKAL